MEKKRKSLLATDLFPVGSDDADVSGVQFGEALLPLCLQQLNEVVDQSFNLAHVEERGTVALSLVFPHHPVEDQRETLRRRESQRPPT